MTSKTVRKIGIGWTIAIAVGLYSFYLSKTYVEDHRYEAMKARERIYLANTDETKTVRKSLGTF